MAAGKSSTTKAKKKQKTAVARKKAPAARAAKKKAPTAGAARRKAPAAAAKKQAAKAPGSRAAAGKKPAAHPPAPKRPVRRTAGSGDPATLGVSPAYLKALADYEKAMTVFHKREFAAAQKLFDQLIDEHAGERDLADRARIYTNLCRRQTAAEAKPKGFDDYYYRGIVLSNQGDHDGARELFQQALQLQPDSGKAHYSLAACQAQVGEITQALQSLRRAVELDADNRLHARSDEEFLPLRGTPEFDEIVGLGDPEMLG